MEIYPSTDDLLSYKVTVKDLFQITSAIHIMENYLNYGHPSMHMVAYDMTGTNPLFEGKPLEIWLEKFQEEWKTLSREYGATLSEHKYMAVRAYQTLYATIDVDDAQGES